MSRLNPSKDNGLSNASNIHRGASVDVLSGNWNVYHDMVRDYKNNQS